MFSLFSLHAKIVLVPSARIFLQIGSSSLHVNSPLRCSLCTTVIGVNIKEIFETFLSPVCLLILNKVYRCKCQQYDNSISTKRDSCQMLSVCFVFILNKAKLDRLSSTNFKHRKPPSATTPRKRPVKKKKENSRTGLCSWNLLGNDHLS